MIPKKRAISGNGLPCELSRDEQGNPLLVIIVLQLLSLTAFREAGRRRLQTAQGRPFGFAQRIASGDWFSACVGRLRAFRCRDFNRMARRTSEQQPVQRPRRGAGHRTGGVLGEGGGA